MDSVDEIKQKLDIVTVVGEYVQLKKAGANFKGACPFHNEKSPSFFVTPDRQIFHCFGCSEGGDMFTFIQKIEGVEFPEALRILAKKAGVELKSFDPRTTSLKNKLQDVCSAAASFWHGNLTKSIGKKANDYIKQRGLNTDTVEKFKIGYAPDSWDLTMKHLLGEKFTETEIFQAGLTIKNDKGGYYDRFRDRLIFPIQDLHGNMVGFTGRALKSDEPAKYINTPESLIYHKSKVLYGLDKAKKSIRQISYAVVVEGNMDVIACHQAGYENVVACSGTALTLDQIQLIKRYTPNVALCFDQDEAGQLAAQRSIDLLFSQEMNVKIVNVITGKDPDECIKNNPKDWEESLRKSKSAMQFYFDKYLTEEALQDINKKKVAAKNILQEISKIKDKIEKDHWIKKSAETLGVKENLLWESLPGGTRIQEYKNIKLKQNVDISPDQNEQPREKTKEEQYFERVITILLNYPELIAYAEDYFLPEMVHKAELQEFYKSLILYYNENVRELTKEQINQWIQTDGHQLSQGYLDSLVLYVDKIYEDFDLNQINLELVGLINSLKINFMTKKVSELSEKLNQAEKVGDHELIDKYIKDITVYSEQLAKLK
ncbi:DNA primase [Candidatus Kuenenbacteria bacterium]|nr:DNA primase [Candidatus Kuenenbacteria bacterium]